MTDSYVPIDDLADHLTVKASTIRQWVNKGYIPNTTYIKVGYTYRFNIPEVVAALKQEPPPEVTPQDAPPVQLELDFSEEEDI
jgi:hypothetical protein